MINPKWFELPITRTNFHGPKGIRAIEVRLYLIIIISETFIEKFRPYFTNSKLCQRS